MTYQEAVEYLFSKLPVFQYVGQEAFKPGLVNIQKFCAHLGHPEKKFRSIHVAGTNGKGSVSHFLASILQEAGYRTGLVTSPHLKSFTERIRINGIEIEQEAVIAFIESNQNFIEALQPSFFEATTAMAFWYMAEKKVEIAVIEVGMGGRLDSTNIISPILSVITNIGYDHQQYLGDTLPLIAGEKAGIIKPHIPVIISEHHPETAPVFLKKAESAFSPIFFAEKYYTLRQVKPSLAYLEIELMDIYQNRNIFLRSQLTGHYQTKNLLAVLKAVDQLKTIGLHISDIHLQNGISKVKDNTHLKGRWQMLQQNPLVIADTAHNPDGVAQVVANLEMITYKKLHLVLGFVEDKKLETILPLYPSGAIFYFCKPSLKRAMPLEKIVQQANLLGINYSVIEDVNQALQEALDNAQPDDVILVGGSTFVVAEIEGL